MKGVGTAQGHGFFVRFTVNDPDIFHEPFEKGEGIVLLHIVMKSRANHIHKPCIHLCPAVGRFIGTAVRLFDLCKKTKLILPIVFGIAVGRTGFVAFVVVIKCVPHNGKASLHFHEILKIEAVVSGTLNYIFNELSADVPFSETIRRAKEQGYSEPDPRIDLSGKDVIRKLVILAREAGYVVEQEDVEKHLFIPENYFEGSLDDFWKRLPELDAPFEQKRKQLEAEGKRWRFVATVDHGKTCVSLITVDRQHPFYTLEGSNNIILLTTERYKEYPMMIQGYGAGAGVTAAGVFADIMSIANV